MAKTFSTATAFKSSLEARLRTRAAETNLPIQTIQLKLVMERLLARLFDDPNSPWLLKGGFAMDLRYRPHARMTKDIDLSVSVTRHLAREKLRERIQTAADIDRGDYFSFRISGMKAELTNAPRGGGRFHCEAVILGKPFAKFNLDVGIGDARIGTPERLLGDNLLDFAGIPPAFALAIPKSQQFAEKVHAYTYPWVGRLNTRTKDLVDLVILIERGAPDPEEIKRSLALTFATRNSHPLPTTLAPPPGRWKDEFVELATEAGLASTDYLEAFRIFDEFWIRNEIGE